MLPDRRCGTSIIWLLCVPYLCDKVTVFFYVSMSVLGLSCAIPLKINQHGQCPHPVSACTSYAQGTGMAQSIASLLLAPPSHCMLRWRPDHQHLLVLSHSVSSAFRNARHHQPVFAGPAIFAFSHALEVMCIHTYGGGTGHHRAALLRCRWRNQGCLRWKPDACCVRCSPSARAY